MAKIAHLFLAVTALAVAATILVPGTGAAFPVDTSSVPTVSPGVVKWRFQVGGQYVLSRPAVGPDGGVVVASSSGAVYSLTAQGALRWVVPFVGSDGPSIGADGTTYVGSGNTITAIAANGSIRWSFTEPSAGQGVTAGPTVGPDGNIYVISDYGGLGAFALSPAGQLLWSNPGNPTFSEYGQFGAEIVFGSGRLYAAFDEFGVASSTMFGLSLGGTQEWARAIGGSDDMFMQRQRQPAIGADGSLYLTTMGGANGWGLKRVDPNSGNVLWNYSPWPSNGMSPPSVGPDGSVYFSRSLAYLESVAPTGQSRWTFSDGSIVDQPAVSPDGSIVVAGSRPNFGEPGSARGWNASTGALAWQVVLPNEDGGYQIVYTQPRFSADSGTAYFGTAILAGGDNYSYLYAVDTGTGSPPPPAQCAVPDVVGMLFDRARENIRAAGCSAGRTTWVRSEKPGRVFAQNPAAGTKVPLGEPVDLTVGRR
jgi:PASTA domain/PQQ-like domain